MVELSSRTVAAVDVEKISLNDRWDLNHSRAVFDLTGFSHLVNDDTRVDIRMKSTRRASLLSKHGDNITQPLSESKS